MHRFRPPVKAPSLPTTQGRVLCFTPPSAYGTLSIGGVSGIYAKNHWRTWLGEAVAPLFDQGLLRNVLWMPFGTCLKGDLLDFYAYAETRNTALAADFVLAVKDLTAKYPGRKLVAYYGSLGTRHSLPVSLKEADAWACVQPLIDAGITALVVDGAANTLDGTWEQKFLAKLVDGGMNVYVEARPYKTVYENGYSAGTLGWVHTRPWFCDREFFLASDSDSNAWHGPASERVLFLHSQPPEQQIPEARKTLAMKDSVGVFSVCAQLFAPCVESKKHKAAEIWA